MPTAAKAGESRPPGPSPEESQHPRPHAGAGAGAGGGGAALYPHRQRKARRRPARSPPRTPQRTWTPTPPAVTLTLDQTALELTVGGTGKLTASGAEGITWTSSNAGVAAVGEDGTVTAVAAGTATISASAEGADPVTCTVTVKEAPKKDLVLRSIYQSEGTALTEFTMKVGADPVPMTVDGTDSTVKWSTENSGIATVNSDGEVTAVSSGRTTIIAEVDGQTLKCEVLVN